MFAVAIVVGLQGERPRCGGGRCPPDRRCTWRSPGAGRRHCGPPRRYLRSRDTAVEPRGGSGVPEVVGAASQR
ncbi:hypothetical protein Ae406Ps2_4558 [Pseudonocardia sp. Ae406_Ps2]|nr:hypothetical protein Ae331Ps2_1394c [Pseudonocardia sp. Ae331_Ps2]OLM04558.1 hypothetical protein Ae406Ps2_4558 [Pseudonocardia sp. Ae406_Ps2]